MLFMPAEKPVKFSFGPKVPTKSGAWWTPVDTPSPASRRSAKSSSSGSAFVMARMAMAASIAAERSSAALRS